jgi:hypothetical protein
MTTAEAAVELHCTENQLRKLLAACPNLPRCCVGRFTGIHPDHLPRLRQALEAAGRPAAAPA